MKSKLNIIICFFVAVFGLFGCMPVQQALNPNQAKPNTTVSHNRNTNSNSHKPTTKQENPVTKPTKTSSEEEIYTTSSEYLETNSDKLTKYCMSWVGTPHRLGGTTKSGVDCSGFVMNVYKDVFGITLPRSSSQMEAAVEILKNKSQLKEGDLVFFGKNSVNHVGIFLKDDKFIHTSTSKGVIVSSLNEKYWLQNYRSCGHHPYLKTHTHKK